MSTSLICRAILTAVLSVLPLSFLAPQAAQADEQIVLPFECDVIGGRVQMRPSSDQAYRVYGARQEQRYRACSEQSPDRCRTFLVHRFTMACGRNRVEWPEAYEAIARATDGRAFFNNEGALYYRMGPREPRDSYPFPDRRPATGVVEMPNGFAPIAGVDAIFTPLDPKVAELEDGQPTRETRAYREPLPSVATAPSDKPAFSPALTPNAPPKQAAARSDVVLEPKPVPLPEAKSTTELSTSTRPLETASTRSAATPANEQAKVVPPTAAVVARDSAQPMVPTILNNPAAKEVESAAKSETVVAAAEVAPAPAAPIVDAGARVEGWSANGDGSGIVVPPIALAIFIAAATLAVLLVILKRQSEATVAAGPMRVAFEPVLPGLEPRAGASQALAVRVAPEPPVVSTAAVATAGVPSTRAEALSLLGLNADASEPVIRKLVEALRQSWHPDLAATPEDRSAREERMKAINAAADLLLRKAAA